MPINVSWENDTQTVIRCEFLGEWTWDDYDVMVDQAVVLIKSVNHRVNIISDITRSARMPKGNGIQHLRRMRSKFPPNMGVMITVGKYSAYAAAILNAFMKVYYRGDFKTVMVRSIEDAHTALAKQIAS